MYAELNQKVRHCNTCRIQKPFSDFQKDCRDKDGISKKCKPCIRTYRHRPEVRAYDQAYNRRYAQKNAERIKVRTKRNNLRRYGISDSDFYKMLEEQNHRCAICGLHKDDDLYKILSVDHDHKTGKIRGLLCNTCNRGLGLLRDDVTVLLNAVAYLRRFRTEG